MESARWLDGDEARAWRGWLAMADRLHSQLASDLLAESGLSYADYQILVHLSEADGRRIRMSDLADRLDWSKSRASHQVARMQARGLVAREECPSDARGAFAVLTDAGMDEIRSAAPGHVASVRRHFIDLLGPEDLATLAGISHRVLEHLRSQSMCTESACMESIGGRAPCAGNLAGELAGGAEPVSGCGGEAGEGDSGAED